MNADERPVVRVEVGNGIGRVTLDRPDQLNAITVALGAQLVRAFEELGRRDDVHVILLRGAGGTFSAGGDFNEVQRLRAGGPGALAPLFENFSQACAAIARIDQPVVAAVEGVAMAGGFELMQAADVVLVHAEAKICDNHVNFGQVPGGGGSQRLPRLVGRQRALAHLLTGDRMTGTEAVALGLAYRAFAAADFDREVEQVVATMAARRPDALRTIKRLVHDGLALPLDKGIALEQRAVLLHISGEAGGVGVSTFAGRGAS